MKAARTLYKRLKMFDTEDHDLNSIRPTILDTLRLEDLEIGDTMESESGNFKVLRYKKEYVLFLLNHVKKQQMKEFISITQMAYI